jgi:hypothetical protein
VVNGVVELTLFLSKQPFNGCGVCREQPHWLFLLHICSASAVQSCLLTVLVVLGVPL